jgi:pyruvate/2-oxoglutarate/acetoin dehydrogenase E1 component
MLWLYEKHLSGVVSNLKPIPQLWLYDHIMQAFDHLSIYATKTRTKIAYEYKAKRKLKQTKLKFSNKQNH